MYWMDDLLMRSCIKIKNDAKYLVHQSFSDVM